jgi:hypothetical protein
MIRDEDMSRVVYMRDVIQDRRGGKNRKRERKRNGDRSVGG